MAVATAQRVPSEIPTIAESGLPGYEGLLFYALVAPAKTPQAIDEGHTGGRHPA